MSSSSSSTTTTTAGVGYAVGAYLMWGLVPIYWKNIQHISALEALAPRIVCTGLLMAIVLLVSRRTHELRAFGRAGLARALLAVTLLSLNWLTFVYAIQTGRVLDTSLGYYINPIASIVLGLIVLRERLNRVQALAAVVAGLGVAYLTWASGGVPWIAAVLATSFALYGLVHKIAPSPPLAGLAVEMWLATPLVAIGWLWLASRGEAELADASLGMHAYMAGSAIITALPLLFFHAATRRLPLFAVGMFQYLAPTMALLLAVFVYGEAFSSAHRVGFGCVWIGLALFTGDTVWRAPAGRLWLRGTTST